MDKKEFMFIRGFSDACELCDKGYRVKNISKDRNNENKFIIWFFNEGDLEKEISLIKERNKNRYEERIANL